MNWDILMGRGRQVVGRFLQDAGSRFGDRAWTLRGEALEYAGRLQMRYGTLKHQAQWGGADFTLRAQPIVARSEPTLASRKKSISA